MAGGSAFTLAALIANGHGAPWAGVPAIPYTDAAPTRITTIKTNIMEVNVIATALPLRDIFSPFYWGRK
jgi:hypothetical protein